MLVPSSFFIVPFPVSPKKNAHSNTLSHIEMDAVVQMIDRRWPIMINECLTARLAGYGANHTPNLP